MHELVVKTALDMFSRYGIKRVSMSAISEEIGISKKTLYEKFSSKDELVYSVVKMFFKQIWEEIEDAECDTSSHLKTILQVNLIVYRHINILCPAFYRDVHFFTEANGYIDEMQQQLCYLYLQHFKAGVKDGTFIPDENYGTLAKLYSSAFQDNKSEYNASLMPTLQRGVCTTRGIDELKNYRALANYFIIQQSKHPLNNEKELFS